MYDKLRRLTAEMITPLTVGGMTGRLLTHPSRGRRAGRTIVFIYGIHGSLERFYGVIKFLARFGTVVAPDLPGFGGMETFYKVGRKPSLDAYGDYLAEFLAQEIPEGPITLVGLSYGLIVITRMLVRHPKLSKRAELVVSVMGLAEGSDLKMKWPARIGSEIVLAIGRSRLLAPILSYVLTRPWLQNLMYTERHPKMRALEPSARPGFIQFETYLWRVNDMRTYSTCMHELFSYRQPDAHVALPLHHIQTARDHWLDPARAAAHLGQIYDQLIIHDSEISNHGGVAYTDETEAFDMIPKSVIGLLEVAP